MPQSYHPFLPFSACEQKVVGQMVLFVYCC